MALTTFAANELLDHLFGVGAYTMPTTVYVALFTVAPTDAYTSASPDGTEVSTGGYARMACAFDAAASRATANTALETWTASGASYGTVVAIGVFDASTAGNLLWWDGLETNRLVEDTTTFEIAAGALDAAFSAS